jgi:hypothetical protein
MSKYTFNFPKTVKISQQLENIISLALNRALWMGRMFTPSLLIEKNGKRLLYVFDAGSLEKGVDEGRKFAKKLPPDVSFYVLAYDGFTRINNKKVDTIIIEAGERGANKGIILVQPYKDSNVLFIKRITPNGNAFLQEETRNYLNYSSK